MIKSTYRFPMGNLSEEFTDYLNTQGVRYSTKDEGRYLIFVVYEDNFRINKFARKLELNYMIDDCNTRDFKTNIRDKNRRTTCRECRRY